MDEKTDSPQPSIGAGYAWLGVLALVLAAGLLSAADGESEALLFWMGGVAATGTGCYLLIAGGVARGIQLAGIDRGSRAARPGRRSPSAPDPQV